MNPKLSVYEYIGPTLPQHELGPLSPLPERHGPSGFWLKLIYVL